MKEPLPRTVPEKYRNDLYYWKTIMSAKDLPHADDDDERFICTLTGDDPHSGIIAVFQADYDELANSWNSNDGKISYLVKAEESH
jgi:hypothetical protein